MEQKNTKDAPLGILLITTFWIFSGVWFISMMSYSSSYNIFTFIFTLMGTFFIFLGWGLLTLQRWAWIASVVISIIGLVISIEIAIGGFFIFIHGSLLGIVFILFTPTYIAILWYLTKKKEIFPNKNDRYCFLCSRKIPIDSRICPYCAKELDEFEKNAV